MLYEVSTDQVWIRSVNRPNSRRSTVPSWRCSTRATGTPDRRAHGTVPRPVSQLRDRRVITSYSIHYTKLYDGRGTSTFDGVSIAWAVAEYLHDHAPVAAKTLFATHYHELTELGMTRERIRNYNVAVREWNDQVVFLRRIVPGPASHSYGIQVARLAGLPGPVIERAKEVLRNLEAGELDPDGSPRLAREKENHLV